MCDGGREGAMPREQRGGREIQQYRIGMHGRTHMDAQAHIHTYTGAHGSHICRLDGSSSLVTHPT